MRGTRKEKYSIHKDQVSGSLNIFMGVKINFALVITRIEIKVLLIRLKKKFGNAIENI